MDKKDYTDTALFSHAGENLLKNFYFGTLMELFRHRGGTDHCYNIGGGRHSGKRRLLAAFYLKEKIFGGI